MKAAHGIKTKYQNSRPSRRAANCPNWVRSWLHRKLALCKLRHSHQKNKTLADKSFKAAACWVRGTVVCNLCSAASTIYLYSCFEADCGCPFQIWLSQTLYSYSYSLSDGVQFLNLHQFPLTHSLPPHDTHFFSSEMLLTVHHSHPLQPCHISSCSPYHFPFPATLLSTACTLLNIHPAALWRSNVPLAGAQLHLFARLAQWLLERDCECWKQRARRGLKAVWGDCGSCKQQLCTTSHTAWTLLHAI